MAIKVRNPIFDIIFIGIIVIVLIIIVAGIIDNIIRKREEKWFVDEADDEPQDNITKRQNHCDYCGAPLNPRCIQCPRYGAINRKALVDDEEDDEFEKN